MLVNLEKVYWLKLVLTSDFELIMIISKKLHIKGLVQGVGFRPAIYRIAVSNNICGTVENNNTGVIIHAEGNQKNINRFIYDVPKKTPPASNITSFVVEKYTTDWFLNLNFFLCPNL